MKKIVPVVLLTFTVCFYSHAQQHGQAKIDSLEAVLRSAKEDTGKVNVLNILAEKLANVNPDTSILFCSQALRLAENLKWQLGIAKSHVHLGLLSEMKGDYTLSLNHYNSALEIYDGLDKAGGAPNAKILKLKSTTFGNIGIVYDEQSDYSRALDYYSKALKMADELGDKNGIARHLTNIAGVYKKEGDYPNALNYYSKALKMKQESGDKETEAVILGNMGSVYTEQSDYPKALEYYFTALKMEEDGGDKSSQTFTLGNIGEVYKEQGDYSKALEYDLKALQMDEEMGTKNGITDDLVIIGTIYGEKGDYDKAQEYFLKALKMAEELGYMQSEAYTLYNLGNVYSSKNDYPKAYDNYFKSLKMAEEFKDKKLQASVLGDMGALDLKQSKLKEADKFLQDALKIATEIKALNLIEGNNEKLSELYSKEGDWKKATEYYKQAITARDSINNEEKAKKQTRIEMNYEFEKTQAADSAKHEKEMAVASVENKRQKLFRNVSIGGFSVMLLFAGVFFTQRNRISKGKKRSDELLLNILPSETAEELKATGTAKAKSYDMVTVLFTDFKNFTQASEKMSAEELVNEIHYCYSEFDKIIAKHNIEKIKTIGDSYMCAGGLPVENKTNPVEVVRAGLEIQQFIAKEKEERQKSNKPFFEIRIGMNTGPVVAGIVGIKKFAYDIWGDTVNIASRMESSGEVGKVNISGSTYELVKDKFTCTHRGKIDAKNKGMIDMYFVEGVTTQA